VKSGAAAAGVTPEAALAAGPAPPGRPGRRALSAASLDHLSGGRVTLGVSQGPEFRDFGEEADPRVRGDMLDEGLAILRAAWTGAPVSHAGVHDRLDAVTFRPPPLQPAVPIWGATERTSGRPARRAATLDGVFPFGLAPAQSRPLGESARIGASGPPAG
jgi:alkanesulfonate monooxygenase SsuD/methylene tetrahydromethanopterin reductase-like flavin-dependent oxidoreductase (luciferase family)